MGRRGTRVGRGTTVRHKAVGAVAGLLFTAILAGCGGLPAATGGTAADRVELTVFAAASLRDAFGAARESYEASHPGVTVTFSFDGSGTLRTQLEQGARADLFASADEVNPGKLVDAGLAAGKPVPFASNRLALVVPAGNPAGLTSPFDLARPGVRLVGAGATVPITEYAAQMVGTLAGLPGAPRDFAAAVEANVVSREDNVRAVLAKVELGEGDAAIVYATDATAAGDAVELIPLPDEVNVPVIYAAVVLRDAPHQQPAARFLAWLAGAEGQAVLARFGFTAPAPR
jgi:molybdate transport system substrate-binding protein